MAGTKLGGQKAAATNKSKYGKSFYARIGKKGGSVRSPRKGFGQNRELAVTAGRLGGHISKRVKRG